jgi:ketosteroid isomerase-like protein
MGHGSQELKMNLTPTNTVTAAYEAFGRRDIPKIFALFAPDIEIIQSEELPWGGRFQGHEGARQFFSKLTAWLNSTLEIERLISSGDHVVAVGWTTGKVNASGASYRVPVAHVWKVRDGLVRAGPVLHRQSRNAGGSEP